MPRSVPYHCLECLDEDQCGYNGILVFEDQALPYCNHHDDLGPVLMVPVHPEAADAEDLHVDDRAA